MIRELLLVWQSASPPRMLDQGIVSIDHGHTSKAVEVLTVFEGHRLLRPDEMPTGE